MRSGIHAARELLSTRYAPAADRTLARHRLRPWMGVVGRLRLGFGWTGRYLAGPTPAVRFVACDEIALLIKMVLTILHG